MGERWSAKAKAQGMSGTAASPEVQGENDWEKKAPRVRG